MILAKGFTFVNVDAGVTVVLSGLDLSKFVGRELTLAIAYNDLTTYTGVNALLNWGLATEGGGESAPGVDNTGVADTDLAGTVNGAYSKRMHIGGDYGALFLDPVGTGGSVTVHWAIIG